jgi:hypothetical protein
MTESPRPPSWWLTLPGVLTALAALITAITGLAALLFQSGILGGKAVPNHVPEPAPAVVATPAPVGPDASTSPAPQAQTAGRSWSDAVTVVLDRDGVTTRLRADSFSNCISVNHEISLEAGQSIPFERISSLEVLHADDHTSPNARAQLKIQLLDGTDVLGTVDAGCDLFGYNDVGRFTTYYDRVRRIQFER